MISHSRLGKDAIKVVLTIILFVLLITAFILTIFVDIVPRDNVIVGSYYYIWWGLPPPYKNHWNEDIKGHPILGQYNSSDPQIADIHILIAKQHKINFFAVSWLGVFDWFDHCYIDEYNLKMVF